MKIAIKARLAFPDLFEAKKIDDDPKAKPRFGACFIMEPPSDCVIIREEDGKKTRTASTLKHVVNQVAVEKWKDKGKGILGELRKKDRVCHRETPKTNKSGDVYDGFQGMHWIQAGNEVRPIVLDRNKSPLTAQDGRVYAGCYVNATIDVWAQDNKYGQRINATLLGVQFERDGDAFSGGAPADADDFDDLGDGADTTDTEDEEGLA